MIKLITDSVDEGEFADYVRFIDEYKKSFDAEKAVILASSVRKYNAQVVSPSSSRNRLLMVINGGFSGGIHIPLEHLKLLSDKSLQAVEEAESGDSDRQLEVGMSLIEGRRDFPFDVKTGLNFLKASLKGGNKKAAACYVMMLIEEKVVPQNHPKARKLID